MTITNDYDGSDEDHEYVMNYQDDNEMFFDALRFAAKCRHKQRRDASTDPYFVHVPKQLDRVKKYIKKTEKEFPPLVLVRDNATIKTTYYGTLELVKRRVQETETK